MAFLPILCLFLFVLFSATDAQAAQILMKNGDIISGKITNRNDSGMLHMLTKYGPLHIPWTDIDAVKDSATIPNQPYTKSPAKPRYVSRRSEADYIPYRLSAPLPDHDAHEAKLKKVKTAEREQPKNSATQPELAVVDSLISTDVKWSGEVNLGAQIRRGNSDQERLNIDGKVEFRRPKDRLIAAAEINQNKNAEETTEDDRTLELIYDYFLKSQWFLQARAEFEQDDVANLDLRTIIQPSIGYQFYESDPLNLKATSGLNFQHEEFASGASEDTLGYAWSLDYDQQVLENLKIFHNHDLTTPFEDFDAFLFESKTGVKSPVFGALDATAEIDFDFDNAPALGARKNDIIYRLKLGYSW